MTENSAFFSGRHSLPDGRIVYLRAIERGDRTPLREELFLKLSMNSLRNRFLAVKMDLSPLELSYFCEVDFVRHVAIVAEVDCGSHRRLVGVARFVRETRHSEDAEIAITVIDNFQGMGVGSLLIDRLIHSARELGVVRLEGMMLVQNLRMANLLRKTRLPYVSTQDSGVVSMSLAL
jgi:GNAT superfamily N-acetyltransferase